MKEKIRKKLFQMQDKKYREFQGGLIPTEDGSLMIGVRTPDLRSYAKELAKRDDISEFLDDLPHEYFDENQLHAFIISEFRDYEKCLDEVCRFLPYVNNWATCDQMGPKVFKKHKKELLPQIKKWIKSKETYTIRFAIKMLMTHFLDDDFDIAYPEIIAGIRSDEYYVNMMIAWYFATALAKQWDRVIPFIEEHKLSTWTHNKAIQKSVESNRISGEQKEYLKSLKVK
ncbi:MAG: DNA alkylation repair protein [Eubacterium sp.]|nr:DNA alkylation repair protein [Eubacterium sp.]